MAQTIDVIVVGAGVGGCVAARRLADAGLSVRLIEAGPVEDLPASVLGPDPLAALGEPDWTWPGAAQQGRSDWRGRGLGGGSAVNGMLLMAGDRSDAQSWGGTSLVRSLENVATTVPKGRVDDGPLTVAFRRVVELSNAHDTTISSPSASTAQLDGDGLLVADLALLGGRRQTVADLLLRPVPTNVELVGDAEVVGLMVEGSAVVGVETVGVETVGSQTVGGQTSRRERSSGNTERFRARHVVLACGALRSPAMVLAAGLGNQAMGQGLKDHPAIAFVGSLVHSVSGPARPASAVLRWSSGLEPNDLLTIPFESVPGDKVSGGGVSGEVSPLGLMLTASARVASQGHVTAEGFDRNWLAHPDDRRRLRHAVRATAQMLSHPTLASVVSTWFIDDTGRGFDGLPSDDDGLDRWMFDHIGGFYHAACSARYGAAVGPGGVVLGARGLSIIDASVLPDLPRCNPQVAIMAMAEWLAADLASALA